MKKATLLHYKYKVDQARKLKSQANGLEIPKKVTVTRNKLNIRKCEHFLDFLFNNKLLQDVAYGVTNIKFDNGNCQKIAYAVLVTKYSHTISFYMDACRSSGYCPLSKSSLWRILTSIKPSKRKSSGDLDNLTASGINAFETLLTLASKYGIGKTTTEAIQNGKRYLKTNYQIHCNSNTSSQPKTHSPLFALSDVNKTNLRVDIDTSNGCSDDFRELIETIYQIQSTVKDNKNLDDIYDSDIAIKDVIEYIKHLVRDAKQSKAKSYAFDKIDSNSALWLRDFSQKIIPIKYRESQKEYFGKKGMTLHIDVFHPYTNVLFKSGVEISIPYVWCSKDGSVVPERPLSTKRRENRSLCSILFCSEPLCSDTFDTTEQLENHMLENKHVSVT